MKAMGKYKHGKQKRMMENSTFWEAIEKGYFVKPTMHKAFVILIWYVGCRVSEIIELMRSQFTITEDSVQVEIPAKKHGEERGPFTLKRELPNVNLLAEYIESRKIKKRRVFPFTRVTAWTIIKRAFGEKHYPHFFRLNRTVKFLNNKNITRNEIREWMAWKALETVDSYVGYSTRTTGKLSETLD